MKNSTGVKFQMEGDMNAVVSEMRKSIMQETGPVPEPRSSKSRRS